MSGAFEVLDRTPVTFLVLMAYVTMAFVTFQADPERDPLLAYGGLNAQLVANGEPWRMLTSTFLHGGVLHLLFNSYFVFLLGPGLERDLGSLRLAGLYLTAGLAGSIAATVWFPDAYVVVGGSGAAFGMMGAMLALSMRRGRHLLDFLNYGGPRQLLVLIVANLLIGWIIPFISNSAHIGGLLGGFVLAFCFYERGRTRPDRTSRVIQAGWIALLVSLLFYCLAPVVRWSYLDQQRVAEQHNARGSEFARALLLRTEDLTTVIADPARRERELESIRRQAERNR